MLLCLHGEWETVNFIALRCAWLQRRVAMPHWVSKSITGMERGWLYKSSICRTSERASCLSTHYKLFLREAVWVETAAAAKACCLSALLSSQVRSAFGSRSAHEGCVLLASVTVVIKWHVFAENGSCWAVQLGDKDIGHLADGKIVKNCAIWKHWCLAIYTPSLGFTDCAISYIFTSQLYISLCYLSMYILKSYSEV